MLVYDAVLQQRLGWQRHHVYRDPHNSNPSYVPPPSRVRFSTRFTRAFVRVPLAPTMMALSRNPNPTKGIAEARNTIRSAAALGASLFCVSRRLWCASSAAWNSALRPPGQERTWTAKPQIWSRVTKLRVPLWPHGNPC